MRKTILMLAVMMTSVILSSCSKNHIEPSGGDNSAVCTVETSQAHLLLAGTATHPKEWSAVYTDSTGKRLSLPGAISPTIPNTLYFQSNDSLKEFSYLGQQIDGGTWSLSNCGETIILNTNLSGANLPFVLTSLKYDSFQGYFYIPLGANGSIIKVIFTGSLVQ